MLENRSSISKSSRRDSLAVSSCCVQVLTVVKPLSGFTIIELRAVGFIGRADGVARCPDRLGVGFRRGPDAGSHREGWHSPSRNPNCGFRNPEVTTAAAGPSTPRDGPAAGGCSFFQCIPGHSLIASVGLAKAPGSLAGSARQPSKPGHQRPGITSRRELSPSSPTALTESLG